MQPKVHCGIQGRSGRLEQEAYVRGCPSLPGQRRLGPESQVMLSHPVPGHSPPPQAQMLPLDSTRETLPAVAPVLHPGPK